MSATKSNFDLWLELEDPSAGLSSADREIVAGLIPDSADESDLDESYITPFSGVRIFDIANCSMGYQLNSIPRSKISIAVGRSGEDGNTLAQLHEYGHLFKKATRARIKMRASGEYAPGISWPEKDVVIFEGRVASTGTETSSDSFYFNVELVHWLNELDNSSTFGRDSHIGNPTAYTFRGFSSARPPDAGAGIKFTPGSFGALAEADILRSYGSITEDLWGRAIKPIFSSLARRKIIKLNTDLYSCFGDSSESENKQAIYALARIEGVSAVGGPDDLVLSEYTPTLSLYTPAGLAPKNITGVENAIIQMIANQSQESFAQSTFWGKLVGSFAPSLAFAVVPQAEKALVVPFTLGIRDSYCKKIKSDDYYYINKSSIQFRPTRAVAVLTVKTSMSGLTPDQLGDVAACYAPDDVKIYDGQIRVVVPPEWLINVEVIASDLPTNSELASGDEFNTPTTPNESAAGSETVGTIIADIQDYYLRYARWVFVNEALRGRNMQIAGKLRFDIAPGSNVFIEDTADKFVRSESDVSGFYASVAAVNITIDAEKNTATTGMVLTAVRSADENESNKTSTDEHPLYGDFFVGAPLVPDYAFFEEESDC